MFKLGADCMFKLGADCMFKLGADCMFKLGADCMFKLGADCMFKLGADCTAFHCNALKKCYIWCSHCRCHGLPLTHEHAMSSSWCINNITLYNINL